MDEQGTQNWMEANLSQDDLMFLLEDVIEVWGPDADSRNDLYNLMYLRMEYRQLCASER